MSNLVTFPYSFRQKIRVVCLEAERVTNIGGGSKAVAHNIGISRRVLSLAMNGKGVSERSAAAIEKYVLENYREEKTLNMYGQTKDDFVEYLESTGVSEETMEFIFRLIWEDKLRRKVPKSNTTKQLTHHRLTG